jgi:hypothetical protein
MLDISGVIDVGPFYSTSKKFLCRCEIQMRCQADLAQHSRVGTKVVAWCRRFTSKRPQDWRTYATVRHVVRLRCGLCSRQMTAEDRQDIEMNDLPYQISKAAMCSSFGGRRRRHFR